MKETFETRDLTNLQFTDVGLALFDPYSFSELVDFNNNYDAAKETPIDITLNGYVLNGRKRLEAAKLRAYQSDKKHATIKCKVHHVPIRDEWAIIGHMLNLMTNDKDHVSKQDKEYAYSMLTVLPTRKVGEATYDLLKRATGQAMNKSAERKQVYGSAILSWFVREQLDNNNIGMRDTLMLIRKTHVAFGCGKGAAIPLDKIGAARKHLDKLVEAFMRRETPSAAAPKRKAAASATATPGEPPLRATKFFWKDIFQSVRDHFFTEVFGSLDPGVVSMHDKQLQNIVRDFDEAVQKQMEPLMNNFKVRVFNLRTAAKANKGFKTPMVEGDVELKKAYGKLQISPPPASTEPAIAISIVKRAYKQCMRKVHPDVEGGEHSDAAELNAAYELVLKHLGN